MKKNALFLFALFLSLGNAMAMDRKHVPKTPLFDFYQPVVISLKNTNVNKLVYRRPVLESKTAKSAKTEKCLFDCYLQSNFTIYYPDGSVKAWSMNIAAPTCTEAGQIIDAVKILMGYFLGACIE